MTPSATMKAASPTRSIEFETASEPVGGKIHTAVSTAQMPIPTQAGPRPPKSAVKRVAGK
jgi:hypothetical protein